MHTWSRYSGDIFQRGDELENVQDRFRAHFTRELARCLGKRRSIAENFGLVFTETLDCIPISEDEQGLLYRELLSWAKQSAELFPAIHCSYSQQETREIGSPPTTF